MSFRNQGQAELIADAQSGSTRISHQYCESPLQWLGPLDPLVARPCLYLRNPNGGLLAGDQHSVSIQLDPDSHLRIKTQGATRLHPGLSTQHIDITLAARSSLIWIPHPMIPGQNSEFKQTIAIEMDPTARLAYADVWTAGRLGMREKWQFHRLVSSLAITHQGIPVVSDGVDLKYPHAHVQSAGILGSYPCWGSCYLMGDWEVTWATTVNQWSVDVHDPVSGLAGRILRRVDHQAEAIWLNFLQAVAEDEDP